MTKQLLLKQCNQFQWIKSVAWQKCRRVKLWRCLFSELKEVGNNKIYCQAPVPVLLFQTFIHIVCEWMSAQLPENWMAHGKDGLISRNALLFFFSFSIKTFFEIMELNVLHLIFWMSLKSQAKLLYSSESSKILIQSLNCLGNNFSFILLIFGITWFD